MVGMEETPQGSDHGTELEFKEHLHGSVRHRV